MIRTIATSVLVLALSACAGVPASAQDQKRSNFQYVYPAPGCPSPMPTAQSVHDYCDGLTEQQCKSSPLCVHGAGTCAGKSGTYVGTPSADPQVLSSLTSFVPMKVRWIKTADLIDAAYVAAASMRYDQAIGLYTQALKSESQSADSEVLVKRGLVYELKGDKARALGDYCYGVAAANDWQSEQIAHERIVQLTQPQAPRIPIPRFTLNSVLRVKGQPLAPLTIHTPEGWDYLLKLVNEQTGKEDMLIFVRSNSTFKTKAPLGTYRVVGAQGPVWYGEPHYFGEKTRYFKLRMRAGGEELQRF
jgi:tetratricopeptide (TPR) repeat protein